MPQATKSRRKREQRGPHPASWRGELEVRGGGHGVSQDSQSAQGPTMRPSVTARQQKVPWPPHPACLREPGREQMLPNALSKTLQTRSPQGRRENA